MTGRDEKRRDIKCGSKSDTKQKFQISARIPHQSPTVTAGGELPRWGKRDHPGVSPRGKPLKWRELQNAAPAKVVS